MPNCRVCDGRRCIIDHAIWPCVTCEKPKLRTEFYLVRRAGKPVRRASSCLPCINAKRIASYHEDIDESREAARRASYRRRYGISWDEYCRMLDRQGGVCAICKTPPGARRLCVDHDHRCCSGARACGACVRGLLCTACNAGLGQLRDDAELLAVAIDYLRGRSRSNATSVSELSPPGWKPRR